jgi:hypothetical protein
MKKFTSAKICLGREERSKFCEKMSKIGMVEISPRNVEKGIGRNLAKKYRKWEWPKFREKMSKRVKIETLYGAKINERNVVPGVVKYILIPRTVNVNNILGLVHSSVK